MVPEIVKEICPYIPYVPSSPSSCGHFVDPRDENYGDSHYWAVWHDNKPYTDYRSHYFRYLSEFGTLLYASQLLQAEAMRYGVEHLRRHRGRCMGALYCSLRKQLP